MGSQLVRIFDPKKPERLPQCVEESVREDKGKDVFATKPEIESAEGTTTSTGDQRTMHTLIVGVPVSEESR